ncbi:glycosyltransferase family 4 protein [Luteirhabdus pelagi]|uniref:glycosyltransferase family 4 protein n=1 Tax=Luteirhabdus pelagi TaxID=2792783 RepID=UPI0019394AAB|nr:glycosyltransferase family 4 protein [Luteirhabdus pelagi]
MKKILFILHLPPPMHGAAMVGKHIHDSAQINHRFQCRYIDLGTSSSVDESGKKPLKKVGRYCKIMATSIKQLLSFNPNITYLTLTAQGMGFYKDAIIALWAKILGGQTVYHFHNKGVKTKQHRWFDNLLYRIIFKNAKVILLSPSLYEDVQKYVKEEDVYYCENGIPELPETNASKEKNNETVEILFLSNLIETKGVYDLLEACAHLKDRDIPFDCIFVGKEGDISEMEFNKTVHEKGIENFVTYVGPKYGEEKYEAFRSADIFVLYSYLDCFPLVVLEAMQFGLPVVASPEGGIPDMVTEGKTGYLVPHHAPEKLADSLQTLIENKNLRKKLGEKGRERFSEKFTMNAFENRFADIMDRID